MDGRTTWTDCDEARDYVVPYVLSPRDLVFRPDNMDETVPHMSEIKMNLTPIKQFSENKTALRLVLRNEGVAVNIDRTFFGYFKPINYVQRVCWI